MIRIKLTKPLFLKAKLQQESNSLYFYLLRIHLHNSLNLTKLKENS